MITYTLATALLKKGVKPISTAMQKEAKLFEGLYSPQAKQPEFFASSIAEMGSRFSSRLDFLFLLHQGKRKINTNAAKQAQAIQYIIDGKDFAEHFEQGVFEGVGERKIKMEEQKTSIVTNGNIAIYPNPNNGLLYLNNKNFKKYDIIITNALGQIVFEQKNNTSNLSEHNIGRLQNGVYFIVVTNVDGTKENLKFILTK